MTPSVFAAHHPGAAALLASVRQHLICSPCGLAAAHAPLRHAHRVEACEAPGALLQGPVHPSHVGAWTLDQPRVLLTFCNAGNVCGSASHCSTAVYPRL